MMHRILIIGCCGAGKTTLARELGARLGLEPVHLDWLWWRPGWRERGREEFDAELAELLRRPEWILDGNFQRTLPERLKFADTVILPPSLSGPQSSFSLSVSCSHHSRIGNRSSNRE